MSAAVRWIRRMVLPAAVFSAAIALHIIYRANVPDCEHAQESSWAAQYVRSEAYWIGVSLAIPLAFSMAMYRRYREHGRGTDAALAVGGLTMSGIMSAIGCFLIGCCGSPMLGVYLGFFGAAFQPFAKPLSAVLSAVSVVLAWLWMRRRERRWMAAGGACPPSAACAYGPGCAETTAPSKCHYPVWLATL